MCLCIRRPSEEWILTSFNRQHHTLHTGPPELLSRTQDHLSGILMTSLRKAAGASHEVWRKSKCNCYYHIIKVLSISSPHRKYILFYISSSLDISMAMHCSAASWSFHMLHLKQTSSAVVFLSPAQPARQKCLLFQQMETESYNAFAETEGGLYSSIFINLFIYFIYLIDGFPIFPIFLS